MVIAIEPMITLGVRENHTLGNGWTVVTDDGKVAAHYENTVAITKDGRLIMVATDRISAFDHILKNDIVDKGAILTQLSK